MCGASFDDIVGACPRTASGISDKSKPPSRVRSLSDAASSDFTGKQGVGAGVFNTPCNASDRQQAFIQRVMTKSKENQRIVLKLAAPFLRRLPLSRGGCGSSPAGGAIAIVVIILWQAYTPWSQNTCPQMFLQTAHGRGRTCLGLARVGCVD
jgi:hypothetical protein